jgi:hypothetical protein
MRGRFRISCLAAITALALVVQAMAQTSPAGSVSATTSVAGCVEKASDIYTLTDQTSNQKYQLRGGKLQLGRHVQVTGVVAANATPAEGATAVLDVGSVKRVSGSCPGAANGSSGKSFLSRKRGTIASIAVIAGVAVLSSWLVIQRQGEAKGKTPPPHTGYLLRVATKGGLK